MRLFSIIIWLLVFGKTGYGQTIPKIISSKELIGVWQEGTPQGSSAWRKCFVFYKNGKYILHYSQYDDLARIKDVTGKYFTKDSALYLQIESRTEFVGGKLVHGEPSFQMEEFVLEGFKPVVIKQKSEAEPFSISNCKSKNGAKCIQIANNKYYRIFSDPNKYTD